VFEWEALEDGCMYVPEVVDLDNPSVVAAAERHGEAAQAMSANILQWKCSMGRLLPEGSR
jgi:hypothetical protein